MDRIEGKRKGITEPFKKIISKPLIYAGELEPTPAQLHYLICSPLDKDELHHLKLRASLKNEPEPVAPFKIHFYCYSLPDMQFRQSLLFYRKDFAISPLVEPRYIAETCAEFLVSQIQEIANGKMPPRVKATPRSFLLPGVQSELHWRVCVNAALRREVERIEKNALSR